ncbi:hypothetical protein ACFE04_014211 [Oxalis oulophora]
MSDVTISPKRLKKRIQEDTSIVDLPDDILVKIFSQKKVREILLWRCACKTLHATLSFSDRVHAQYHFARSAPMFFVESIDYRRTYTHFIKLGDDETKLSNGFEFMRSGFRLIKKTLRVVNSCNGFVCFGTSYFNPVLVCNPITGEYIKIPKLEYNSKARPHIVCGLGCSLRSREYKVVTITSSIGAKYIEEGVRCSFIVKVLTLGTKSWRRVESVPYYLNQSSCIMYFNGAIHWVFEDSESDYIISFDLESERFAVIPPPENFVKVDKCKISIGVLEGCLYLTHHGQLWVMREYGNRDSWDVVYDEQMWRYRFHDVLMYLSDGRIIMHAKNRIYRDVVAYDLLTKSTQDIRVKMVTKGWVSRRLMTHTPSFISLKDAITVREDGVELEVHYSRARPSKKEIIAEFLGRCRRDRIQINQFCIEHLVTDCAFDSLLSTVDCQGLWLFDHSSAKEVPTLAQKTRKTGMCPFGYHFPTKPPTPQPPQRVLLDPWTRSRLTRQHASPKEEKSSHADIYRKALDPFLDTPKPANSHR